MKATPRRSARVRDKVPSSYGSARSAQLNRLDLKGRRVTLTTDDLRVLWPARAVPGAIAVVGTAEQAVRLELLERAAEELVYTVRVIVADHIPLAGTLNEAVATKPTRSIALQDAPPAMYLHHGGHRAVYFSLSTSDQESLEALEVEVQTKSPFSAFQAARTEANQLLDTLMRRGWLPLIIARLELLDSERRILAYQLALPFSSSMQIGPIGGIHQYPLFSELEAIAREAICATSPYYRLLCAHRLYDGTGRLRTRLRKLSERFNVDVPLPKDVIVDPELLLAHGFNAQFCDGLRTAGDLYGRLTDTRNRVAHFLLTKGGEKAPLHLSDGATYLEYSAAAVALLHYSIETLAGLSAYFRAHLGSKLARGSVLPTIDQRSKFRIYV